MRLPLSRLLSLPVLCATAALGVGLSGCGDKSSDTATQGAYGELAASPVPSATPSPAVSFQVNDEAKWHGAAAATPPNKDTAATPPIDNGGAGVSAPPMTKAPFAGGGGPMMGGGDDPNAPLTATPDMDTKIDGLKSGDKKALAAAYADRGYARMTDQNAGAKVKYRKALDDFRAALQNDPTNSKALENKEMIESIYRDMKRPIPGEENAPAKK